MRRNRQPFFNKENRKNILKKSSIVLMTAGALTAAVMLSGCSLSDMRKAVDEYNAEKSSEDEAAKSSEEIEIFSAQVSDSSSNKLEKSNGEPVTVLISYETAAGGEPRINDNGVLETYPAGEVVTYAEGSPVTNADGTEETYAGGEAVTDIFGIPYADEIGNPATRAAGEVVTHGADEIVYDADGNKVYHTGECLTYAAGEDVYNEDGKRETVPVVQATDADGEAVYDSNGYPEYEEVEIITDEAGDPVLEENGEVATRQSNPEPPSQKVETPLAAGEYYINNITSPYVFFSTPLVTAADINVVTEEETSSGEESGSNEDASSGNSESENDGSESDNSESTEESSGDTSESLQDESENSDGESADAAESSTDESANSENANQSATSEQYINADGQINNLQLAILGENLTPLEMVIDAEGYAYFICPENGQVLTICGDIKNGTNIALSDMVKVVYPQYQYYDDPLYTVADNQKWAIKSLSDGYYSIASYADENYVMTVDDELGTQYANIMLWKYKDKDLQKFEFQTETPKIEKYIEEGTYTFRASATDAMLLSLGDENYTEGRSSYIYTSDRGDGQWIRIVYDDYGFAYLMHNDSNMAISVDGGEGRTGRSICQYEFDGGDWQKWIISPGIYGGYIIRSALNVSETIDICEGFYRCGNPLILNWNNDSLNQNWYIEEDPLWSPYAYDYMNDYAQNYSSNTNYLILINSYNCTVGVYYGYQGNWENINFYSCVTGKSETPTVKGEFSIYYRMPSFDGNEDSEDWYTCYYATGFYPAYYFHSTIYYQGTMDIMDDSMGANLSHGCVRLYIDNAEWIYENIPDGTKVVSY